MKTLPGDRTLQHYLSGKRGVSTNFLTLWTEQPGVSASWVLTGKGFMFIKEDEQNGHPAPAESDVAPDFVPIERFSVEASAGPGALVDEETQTGFYAFNRRWIDRRQLDPGPLAVIFVRGDSKKPKLSEGDLILVDRAQRQVTDGIAYVLRLGSDLLVKHVQRIGPTSVSLLSENRRYPPSGIVSCAIDRDVEIICRVVASMHEWGGIASRF